MTCQEALTAGIIQAMLESEAFGDFPREGPPWQAQKEQRYLYPGIIFYTDQPLVNAAEQQAGSANHGFQIIRTTSSCSS